MQVESGLDEVIILPTTTLEDARDKMLDAERAEKILNYLDRYQYATLYYRTKVTV
jgi:NifB/MoaA-like Fe-S oxidoreductase